MGAAGTLSNCRRLHAGREISLCLYVGNYLDSDLSILKVRRGKITPVKRVKLPGHPASVRMSEK